MSENIIKRLYYDLETTGTDHRKHSIHHLSIIVEIGHTLETFDAHVRPHEKALIDPEALKVCGVDELDLLSYPHRNEVFKDLKKFLSRHVDPFNKTDKFHLVGYNNRGFDDDFFRAWFSQCGDAFFGSWFFAGGLDVMVLAAEFFAAERKWMTSFKLKDVAEALGIQVYEAGLHEAD